MELQHLTRLLNESAVWTGQAGPRGVSGGPDSLACPCPEAASDSADRGSLRHRLRPESQLDRRGESEATDWGFHFPEARMWQYSRQKRASHWRKLPGFLRYRFLFACARDRAPWAVALGHTADDQSRRY